MTGPLIPAPLPPANLTPALSTLLGRHPGMLCVWPALRILRSVLFSGQQPAFPRYYSSHILLCPGVVFLLSNLVSFLATSMSPFPRASRYRTVRRTVGLCPTPV